MIQLSLPQFRDRLRTVSRCQPVGFVAIVTPTRLRRSANPLHGRVRKVTTGHGMINCIFTNAVNNQRLREGLPADFVAGDPTAGKRVPKCPLLQRLADDGTEHWYLEIFTQRSESTYFRSDTKEELSYFDDIKPLEYSKPAGNSLRKSQGTRKLIRPLPYKLQSIAQLTIAGETWHVDPLTAELLSYLKNPQTPTEPDCITTESEATQ